MRISRIKETRWISRTRRIIKINKTTVKVCYGLHVASNYTWKLHKRKPFRPIVNIFKFLKYFCWISVGGLLAKKVNSDPYFSQYSYNTTPYTNQMVPAGQNIFLQHKNAQKC